MHIYTYNLFNPIPKNINNSKPVCLFIKGQIQPEDDFTVKYKWTNTFRHICYYLYAEQSSHILFTKLIDEKYSKLQSIHIDYSLGSKHLTNLQGNQSPLNINLNRRALYILTEAKHILEYCKVNLEYFDFIYIDAKDNPNDYKNEILLATQKIQHFQEKLQSQLISIFETQSNITQIENELTLKPPKTQNTNSLNDSKNTQGEALQQIKTNLSSKNEILTEEVIRNFQDAFSGENEINPDNPISSEDNSTGQKEGSRIDYFGFRYERNPQNRKEAIKIHGTKCKACGFDYEKTYGPFGKDFIEIHHINPLAVQESEIVINPETDLIPLCANCHRMIHHTKPCLSLEELKELIKQNENKNK